MLLPRQWTLRFNLRRCKKGGEVPPVPAEANVRNGSHSEPGPEA